MDSKKKFRVTFDTDPPDAKSANEEARWGKLADVLLKPGAPTNGQQVKEQDAPRSRAP